MGQLIYMGVRLVAGTLYPAYRSFKAVKTKNVKEYVHWMTYWIVFALWTLGEEVVDLVLAFWWPLYWECKAGMLLWLLLPSTRGSTLLYRRLVHPTLVAKEKEIDAALDRWRQEGYTLGVRYTKVAAQTITKTMVETALRGGGGLVDTLRHSYSMGDLRGMEGNQLEYLPREGDPYSDEGPPYGGSEVKGYRSDSRAYKGYRRGGYEGDMKGYESDSRGYGGGGDHQTLSQSWHEPADRPARHGSQYWAGEPNEAPRRRQRANTGTYSSTQHAAHSSTGGGNLLAIEDSSMSSSTPGVKRRSGGGGGLRQRQANSMYGTLPRSGRPARTARQLPETPAPVRRTWHGRESTREELGRTVSASPVRKREGAKVARPVRRPAKKEVTPAVKKEEMEDFSMTYSAEADEVEEDQRRKCDIS